MTRTAPARQRRVSDSDKAAESEQAAQQHDHVAVTQAAQLQHHDDSSWGSDGFPTSFICPITSELM